MTITKKMRERAKEEFEAGIRINNNLLAACYDAITYKVGIKTLESHLRKAYAWQRRQRRSKIQFSSMYGRKKKPPSNTRAHAREKRGSRKVRDN